jgi:nicotinate-nucleotide--dimethylbenzimidazole phosphoribosyltransferase
MQIPAIASPYDAALAARLDARINDKTKPLGSLGALERLARQIGLIQGSDHPVLRRAPSWSVPGTMASPRRASQPIRKA